jgi:hypothetical protein
LTLGCHSLLSRCAAGATRPCAGLELGMITLRTGQSSEGKLFCA